MKQWERAYKDWKSGMKYKEIAKKFGVTESAVKSWANRYFKPKKEKEDAGEVATSIKSQPSELQPKRIGPPYGNHNARGNKGGGAPRGNQNRCTHGIYSMLYNDEEKRLLATRGNLSEEQQLEDLIDFWEVREYRLMQEIDRQRSIATGLAVHSVMKAGNTTTTTAISTFERISVLESKLTSAQKAHARCIEALHKIRIDNHGDDAGNDNGLVAAIEEAAEGMFDVSEIQPKTDEGNDVVGESDDENPL